MTVALLEVLDRDGQVRHYLRVNAWPASVGRALDNDLVLDDRHVAPHHFRIDADESGVFVQVGDSVNGLRTHGRRLAAGERLPVGDAPLHLDAGDSRLCLRLAAHALEAEQPMHRPHTVWHAVWPPLAAGLALLATLMFSTWLDSDPDDVTRAWGTLLISALGAGVVWCAGWSLISKVFTRRTHLLWHMRVLLIGALAINLAGAVTQLLAFALSWPALSDFDFIVTYAIVAAMLYFHLLGLEPRRPQRVRAAAAAMFCAATALSLWLNWQNGEQLGDELYMSHLFPPSLRLAPTVDTATFVKRLAPLQAPLDDKARRHDGGGEAGGDEE